MRNCLPLAVAFATAMLGAPSAHALLIAADDAGDPVYDAWDSGDDGGFGFGPWALSNGSSFGSGGGFTATTGTSIDVAGRAFGVFGNGGGVGQAVRAFDAPLASDQTFSIAMDNQGIDPGGTVGFGLQNATGDNLFEFFFVGGQSDYTVNAANTSGSTPGFTFDGLRLSLTLTDSDSFSFEIDLLGNGPGVDHTVVGDLLAAGSQQIAQLRLFNANGGPDAYFNSLGVSAVPEVSMAVAGPLVAGLLLGRRPRRRPA